MRLRRMLVSRSIEDGGASVTAIRKSATSAEYFHLKTTSILASSLGRCYRILRGSYKVTRARFDF